MRPFYITLYLAIGLFIASLIFGATFYFYSGFVFAADIVIEDYNTEDVIGTGGDDVITVGHNNSGQVKGQGGNDTIIVGNNNSADIIGSGGVDHITVGDDNEGQVKGEGGDDVIIVGNNNKADIVAKGGADSITIGANNGGQIKGEGGDDIIIVGCGHDGTVDDGGGDDVVKTSCLPVASPASEIYTSIQNISLSSEDGASIYYTTDGSSLACSPVTGTLFGSSISIFSTKTINAISCSPQDLASDVATFTYTIEEIEADAEDMSSLVDLFIPTASSSAVTVAQKLTINVPTASGSSQVVLSQNTIITSSGSQPFDTSALTSSVADVNSLTGLAEGKILEAALQWGIIGTTLEFSLPITINIFVGTALDGQTLDVLRSVDGTAWTNEGIVAPATCVVSGGICSFQATKASYYAATSTTPPSSQGGPLGTEPASVVGLQFISNGAGTLPSPTPTPVPEIISTPTPSAAPVALVSVPKKVSKTVAIVKKTPEPTPVVVPVQVPSRSLLASIFALVKVLFSWYN